MSDIPQRVADFLTTYSKTVILVMLLITAGIGAGAGMVEQDSDTGQFESESDATEANEFIQDNFVADDTENQTTVQLIQRGDNVLTQEALIESLEVQRQFRESETINATLAGGNAMFGVENAVARAQLQREARARQRAQSDGGSEQQAGGEGSRLSRHRNPRRSKNRSRQSNGSTRVSGHSKNS